MSEEQIMLKLEMYIVSFCQRNCIAHTCLSSINIFFQSLNAYNFSFEIFVFKALHHSVPDIWRSQ